MTDTRAKTRIFNSELARALAEWESEGGASFQRDRDDHAFLSEADKRVLQCLGAAVIVQWNDLPSHIQRQLFDATSIGEPCHTRQWKEQVARFLHNHKDDIWNRKRPRVKCGPTPHQSARSR